MTGVVLTRSVPDWLIVIILFLMMAFLAVKVVTKGQEMYKAETRHAKAAVHPKEAAYHSQPAHEDAEAVEPASAPQAPESPPASPSPGQVEFAPFILGIAPRKPHCDLICLWQSCQQAVPSMQVQAWSACSSAALGAPPAHGSLC